MKVYCVIESTLYIYIYIQGYHRSRTKNRDSCGKFFGVRLLSGIFGKKTPKRTWLCAGLSPLLFGLRT